MHSLPVPDDWHGLIQRTKRSLLWRWNSLKPVGASCRDHLECGTKYCRYSWSLNISWQSISLLVWRLSSWYSWWLFEYFTLTLCSSWMSNSASYSLKKTQKTPSFHSVFITALYIAAWRCVHVYFACMVWTKSKGNNGAIILIFTGKISVLSGSPPEEEMHKHHQNLQNRHLLYGPQLPVFLFLFFKNCPLLYSGSNTHSE